MAKKLKVNLVPAIKRLEVITKSLVSSMFVGKYKSVFKGKGLDFAGYREYNPSIDDSSLIDWKSSRKANKMLIKEFEEERSLDIFFLIDVSDSMIFGSTDKLKNEYAVELIASLAHLMLISGDAVGWALFNENIVISLPPSKERNQFYILTKTLVDPRNYGGGKDFSNALNFLFNFLPKDSVVFIISDFLGLKGNWKDLIKIVSNKYDTIAIMIKDPRDYILTEDGTEVLIQDPFSKKKMLINPGLVREEYEKYSKMKRLEIKDIFSKANIGMIEVDTDKSFVGPMIDFFRRRAKGVV